jgi:formyltetrahydrofolate synthetase
LPIFITRFLVDQTPLSGDLSICAGHIALKLPVHEATELGLGGDMGVES